jgi:hypothetical protein
MHSNLSRASASRCQGAVADDPLTDRERAVRTVMLPKRERVDRLWVWCSHESADKAPSLLPFLGAPGSWLASFFCSRCIGIASLVFTG